MGVEALDPRVEVEALDGQERVVVEPKNLYVAVMVQGNVTIP